MAHSTDQSSGSDAAVVRRRSLVVLAVAQVFAGLATGTVVSVGSLIAVQITGSRGWAGSMSTAATLGAGVAAVGLARTANARGRRVALTGGFAAAAVGGVLAVIAGTAQHLGLLLVGGVLLGVGSAVNLQARFAATDLSNASSRGRDLSLVVWAGTVGAVTGPNLVRFGSAVSNAVPIPVLPAVFAIAATGMAMAAMIVWIGLRPDPLLLARTTTGDHGAERPRVSLRQSIAVLREYPTARAAISGMVVAHAAMVAVMSMTPVHMDTHGASIELVGLTVSLHVAGMYALAPVMGIATDHLGAHRVMTVGLMVLVAATVVAGMSGGRHGVVVVGLILLGLGWSAATVAGSSIVAGAIPAHERIMIQGISDSMMSLVGAAGAALAGVALGTIGYGGVNLAAGLIVAAGACGLWVVLRRAAPHH